MKKLLGIVFNRWVLAALGLLAVALLIWFAGPLLAFADYRPLESETVRWIVIAIIVAAYLARVVWRALRARQSNSQLIEGLLKQPAAAPRPEEGPAAQEVAALRQRFEEAMGVLRQARLGEPVGRPVRRWLAALSPRQYVYQLPWYIFIGPPGSGKTTALLNAGLNFPLADRLGQQAVRGVGGTRNCDWWFTDDAVLIDTAGRYTTQESHKDVDAAAWTGFLQLLKKNRPRRPINGAIVTVSVSDLLTQSAAQREAQANAIRRRILELHETLGIRFPIYLLLTKADLLAGFMEFFGGLRKEERIQVWGFSFPVADDPAAPAPLARVGQEFSALAKRLNDSLIDRMQQERDPQRRALIYSLPQQFEALREPLEDLLQKVFASTRFEQVALLRGVYLTSGTQEGSPLDRVLGALGRSLGLERKLLAPQRPSGKSFFLSRLLKEVVFAEANLAGTNRRWENRRAFLHVAVLGIAGLVVAGALVAWSISYARNKAYVAQVGERLKPIAKSVANVDAMQSADVRFCCLCSVPCANSRRRPPYRASRCPCLWVSGCFRETSSGPQPTMPIDVCCRTRSCRVWHCAWRICFVGKGARAPSCSTNRSRRTSCCTRRSASTRTPSRPSSRSTGRRTCRARPRWSSGRSSSPTCRRCLQVVPWFRRCGPTSSCRVNARKHRAHTYRATDL